jgi:gliding motility-associated-like protein
MKTLLETYKFLLVFGYLLAIQGVTAQDCPNLTLPVDGSTNVEVNSAISWNNVTGVTAYIISLGTTPGGTDIVNELNIGSATTYTPPLGLPENTQIYVTITLFLLPPLPPISCLSETFRTGDVIMPPGCTTITSPFDGATNINVGSIINWDYAPLATGYFISAGTTPNGTDIANNVNVFNNLSFNPPGDLPVNTTIYVRVTPYNENNPNPSCQEISFTTAGAVPLPNCTTLITPFNGAINVPLTPLIEWNPVPNATGYRLTIGSSPFTRDVLDNAIFTTNSTLVLDFEPNRTFFVTIIPFNATGDAIGCSQETFSTILGCGPFFDSLTGELTFINPEINIPDEIGICLNTESTIYTTTDTAEGFRWYKVISVTTETLISNTAEVNLTESGQYRYEAFNTIAQNGNVIECPTTKFFDVVASEAPTINSVRVTETALGLTLETDVTGSGSYEYALDDINGPYQDSNTFRGVPPGNHTVYVRDKNGCGVAEENIQQDLTLEGFPKFFTPNGDNINDLWQYRPLVDTGEINVGTIYIFNRYGALVAQVDPTARGWNGLFNGKAAPAADYWFKTLSSENKHITGHFTLKR